MTRYRCAVPGCTGRHRSPGPVCPPPGPAQVGDPCAVRNCARRIANGAHVAAYASGGAHSLQSAYRDVLVCPPCWAAVGDGAAFTLAFDRTDRYALAEVVPGPPRGRVGLPG